MTRVSPYSFVCNKNMTSVDNTEIHIGPAIWIAVNILDMYNFNLVANITLVFTELVHIDNFICCLGQLACKYPAEQSKMPSVPVFWTLNITNTLSKLSKINRHLCDSDTGD